MILQTAFAVCPITTVSTICVIVPVKQFVLKKYLMQRIPQGFINMTAMLLEAKRARNPIESHLRGSSKHNMGFENGFAGGSWDQ